MFGPARRVTAFGTIVYPDRTTTSGEPFSPGAPDFGVAVVELESGTVVRLTANFYVGHHRKQSGIELHGDTGSVFLSSWQEFDATVELAPFGGSYEAGARRERVPRHRLGTGARRPERRDRDRPAAPRHRRSRSAHRRDPRRDRSVGHRGSGRRGDVVVPSARTAPQAVAPDLGSRRGDARARPERDLRLADRPRLRELRRRRLGAGVLRPGHPARGGAADHGRRLGARDHDVRHRRRLRRRTERDVDRRVARDEGLGGARHDRHRDEDVQPDGGRRGSRAVAAAGSGGRSRRASQRLGLERIPLYMAHAPDPDTPIEETLAAFDELVRAGTVGAVGASNFTAEQLAEAVEISELEGLTRFEWVQNSFSLLERSDAETVFPVCREHGLGYEAFGPLAGGWLAGRYRRGEAYPEGSRMTQRPDGYRQLRERRRVRCARGLRARSARSRRLDGGTRARLAARRTGGHELSSSDRPARSSSSRFAKHSRSSSRQTSTRIWEACSRDRPERARGPRAPRHGVVHRGDDRGAGVARARRALQPAPLDRATRRSRHAARPHARVSRRLPRPPTR